MDRLLIGCHVLGSLSSRRTWIEMLIKWGMVRDLTVALLTENVD